MRSESYYTKHLVVIQGNLTGNYCRCKLEEWRGLRLDEKPHPSEHVQSCPDYLAAYLGAMLKGRAAPDPNEWPDAPPICKVCGWTRGRHKNENCPEARLAVEGTA